MQHDTNKIEKQSEGIIHLCDELLRKLKGKGKSIEDKETKIIDISRRSRPKSA